MDKTNIDDLLIEMITPKVKEIEEKFGRGEGLTQADIHTLLLKSQYNHINHLDEKLNEVTADVASLKVEFNDKFNDLKGEFNDKFNGLKGEFGGLKGEFIGLRGEFKLLESKFELQKKDIKADIAEFKKDIKTDIADFKMEVKTDILDLKVYIEKTMANFMKWFIGGAGILIVLLKLIDKVFD